MSMRSSLAVVTVALLIPVTSVLAEPNLGRVATPEEIAAASISVLPDGANLPPGRGSVAEGAEVYAAQCLNCHGENGAGDPMERLTGGLGSIGSEQSVKTVASYWPSATSVFDYIRRAMPYQAPQSLTDEQVYAVTAYLLSIDGIVPTDAVLDAASLPNVQMPNAGGFINWWPEPDR